MESTYRRQPNRGYNKDNKEGVLATTPRSSRENAVKVYSLGGAYCQFFASMIWFRSDFVKSSAVVTPLETVAAE